MMPKPLIAEPNIGDIVSLQSHPFFSKTDNNSIYFSGDPETLSPLMVIVETLKETKSHFDENTGTELVKKDSYQCKCLWYSHKTAQFEDTWLSSRLLKTIVSAKEETTKLKFTYGDSVVFITSPIELGKKKVSLKQLGNTFDDKNKTVSGLTYFTSPVLQIIGFAKSESKEPFIDSRTGKIKRWIPSQLVKCKFHNLSSSKFSEILLPIEALSKIDQIQKEIIDHLNKTIKDECILLTKSTNDSFLNTFVKPLKIAFKGGNYYLEALDYLENRTLEIQIENNENQFEPIQEVIKHLPKFEEIGRKLQIIAVNKINLRKNTKGIYWRIKYKNVNDEITQRTIYNPTFFSIEELLDNGDKFQIDYVKAKCILRNHSERYFRVDRIMKVEFLQINPEENLKK